MMKIITHIPWFGPVVYDTLRVNNRGEHGGSPGTESDMAKADGGMMGVALPDRREKRRIAIVAAARRLFLERGFDAVSVGEIVRESGGSLSTLYDLFDSKEGVLASIAIDDCAGTVPMVQALIDSGAPPRETLAMLVRDLQIEFFRPDVIGMMRILMVESMRNAALADLLQQASMKPFDNLLIALFARWTSEGKARIDRPDLAVDLLMGLIVHPRLKRACLGPSVDTDEAALGEAAVAMFALHYGIA